MLRVLLGANLPTELVGRGFISRSIFELGIGDHAAGDPHPYTPYPVRIPAAYLPKSGTTSIIAKPISSVVCSPKRTRRGGLLGLRGLAEVLS